MKQFSNYRYDIDGLRALSVVAVIIFHLGLLPNGYLGVDVFFVISGYLITKIIYNESLNNKFSVIEFYKRRIRRILPLVIFATFISIIIAAFVMLPDDLENFAQSVVGTNLMANNILLHITTGNYWDVANEYKPLMHTWSLAVEEQFYFILPLLFIFVNKFKTNWIKPTLLFLSLISLFLFILPDFGDISSKFYYIQFRFFELGFGGILGLYLGNKLYFKNFKILLLILLSLLMYVDWGFSNTILVTFTVFLSGLLLISESNQLEKYILENKLIQYIGKISFSLYIWHQIVFAFLRYTKYPDLREVESLVVSLLLTIVLSVFSYHFIENFFRNKQNISFKYVFTSVFVMTVLTSLFSVFILFKKGIVRDVPQLNLYVENIDSYRGNIHIDYTERIYNFDKPFTNSNKTKVLVIGNSFARDWANILLESKYKEDIDLSYIYNIYEADVNDLRFKQADVIYFSELDMKNYLDIEEKYNLNFEKVRNVGTKNFGSSNGIIYNSRYKENYCFLKVKIDDTYIVLNELQKKQWGDKYIDLIGLLTSTNEVPVFDYNCKFISSDCTHLTVYGAKFYASKLNNILTF